MARRSTGFVSKRPHKKSRGGCLTCKKKKVKCDEGSPACGYCTTRRVDCTYPRESGSSSESSASPSLSIQQTDPTNTQDVDFELEFETPACLIPAIHTSSGQLSETDINFLNHYKNNVWLTMSYRTEDSIKYLNREWVPMKSINTDYLLYSILSISAAHMNKFRPDVHTNALSLQYRQKALNTYSKALSNITADNYETILMTNWMGALFQMMQGLRVLASMKWAAGIEKLAVYPIFRRELNTLPPPPNLNSIPSDPKFWATANGPGSSPIRPNPPNTYADELPTPESTPSPRSSPTQYIRPISSGRDMSDLPFRPVELMAAGNSPHAPNSWKKPIQWQMPFPAFLPPPLMAILKRLVDPSPNENMTHVHNPTLVPALHALSPIFLSLYYYHLQPDLYVRIIVFPTFLPPQFLALVAQKEARALVIVGWWFAFVKLMPNPWWLDTPVPRVLQAVSNEVMRSNDKGLLDAMEGAYRIVREVDKGGKTNASREKAARMVFEGWEGVFWEEGPKREEEWMFEELINL